jgi:pimeloyl-ACP methyl ester carboxylesterase
MKYSSLRMGVYAFLTGVSTIAVVCGLARPVAAAGVAYGSCQTVQRHVAVGPGKPLDQTIAGTLCTPNTWAPGVHHIDIMVHGATYNRNYWDFPYNQSTYSYVNPSLQAGRATFIYDRLGDGSSSHPAGLSVTVDADAYILHQLIGWLTPTYPQTTVVGHSLGSLISAQETATYNDAKRLVITGYLHGVGLGLGLPQVIGSFYPAALDPQFAGLLDTTYLTTLPGTRASAFYYAPTADPAVIAYDEAHKDLLSSPELAAVPTALETPPPLNVTDSIHVPTLLMMGDHDALFCGLLVDCTSVSSMTANEKPYYKSVPSLTVKSVPGTGHDLTTHPSSHQSHAMMDSWIKTH